MGSVKGGSLHAYDRNGLAWVRLISSRFGGSRTKKGGGGGELEGRGGNPPPLPPFLSSNRQNEPEILGRDQGSPKPPKIGLDKNCLVPGFVLPTQNSALQ